jgi:hypothetical protein
MGPLRGCGDLARALRIASARIRKAEMIVDLPELLGPTSTLKFVRESENCRKVLKLLKVTEVNRATSEALNFLSSLIELGLTAAGTPFHPHRR